MMKIVPKTLWLLAAILCLSITPFSAVSTAASAADPADDKFVKEFITANKLTLQQYAKSDYNADKVADYVILTGEMYTDENIMIVDGKSKAVLAKAEVMIGMESTKLELKELNGVAPAEIDYFTWDGQPMQYLFSYSGGKLVNTFAESGKLLPQLSYDKKAGAYTLNAPTIGKSYTIKVNSTAYKKSISKGGSADGGLWYREFLEESKKPGYFTLKRSVMVGAIDESEKLEVKGTFKWEKNSWILSAIDIKSMNKSFVVTSKNIPIPKPAATPKPPVHWYDKGTITITKDNLDKFMCSSKDELKKLIGNDKIFNRVISDPEFEGTPLMLMADYSSTDKQMDKAFFYGDYKHTLFGLKSDATKAQIKAALGTPKSEGMPENDFYGEDYQMTYEIGKYSIIFGFQGEVHGTTWIFRNE